MVAAMTGTVVGMQKSGTARRDQASRGHHQVSKTNTNINTRIRTQRGPLLRDPPQGYRDGDAVQDTGAHETRAAIAARQVGQRHTERDVVAGMTQGTKVEGRILNGLPLVQETDGDGHSVTGSEADDANAGEGVEGGSGAKVDETEDDLDDHGQHHGVERHAQLLVDRLPQPRPRNSAVPSEGPDATGAGGCAPDAADESEHKQGDEQCKGTA